jgi:hypothetical protein
MHIRVAKDMMCGRLVGIWNDRMRILKYFDNLEQ